MSIQKDPVSAMVEAYQNSQAEIEQLRESFNEVRAMLAFEDQGWKNIFALSEGSQEEGLRLEDVKRVAELLAPKVAAASLEKRAVDLHSGFVWGKGCHIDGTEKPKTAGAPTKVRKFYIDRGNQEALFGDAAREELQKERFISGNVLVTVNPKTGKANRIPFRQVIDVKVDRDFPENIIAYKREWDTQDGTKDSVKQKWYYTARFDGERKTSFTEEGGKTVPVAVGETIVDLRANRQVGHILGVPDGLPGMFWAEAYGRIMKYGETVQESMAKILFKVTSPTKKGAQSAGVKIANFGDHGGTASMGNGQELQAIATAGKGYDFASARPVGGMAASAWNVSLMDLLNDSSAAGSSYGSANALVGGNRNAMLLMQREWADFYKTIFEVACKERPSVVFEPFDDPDPYRAMQALKLGELALSDQEIRMKTLDILDIIGDSEDIPDLLKMRTDNAKAAVQQGAPDQGKSNGTSGGGQGANDLRTDTISKEALRIEMAFEDQLSRMRELVEALEALKNV